MNKDEVLSEVYHESNDSYSEKKSHILIYGKVSRLNVNVEYNNSKTSSTAYTQPSTKEKINEEYIFTVIPNTYFKDQEDEEDALFEELFNDEEPSTDKNEVFICLKDNWKEMKNYLSINQSLSLFGEIKVQDKITVLEISLNTKFNYISYLIIEPEYILSPSIIKSAYPCVRKSVFGENFKFYSNTKSTIIGNIIHEVFQSLLINDKENMDNLIKDEVEKNKLSLLAAFSNKDEIFDALRPFKQTIKDSLEKYFTNKSAIITINAKENFTIKKTLGNERALQCHVYGIKGISDVLLKAKIKIDKEENEVIVPLEIKTGNAYNEDYYQLICYSLIINQIFKNSNFTGVLIYLKSGQINKRDIKPFDLTSILLTRNKIAYYLKNFKHNYDYYSNGLPDLFHISECERCFNKNACHINYYVAEDHCDKEDKLKERTYFDITKNLITEEYKTYYTNYIDMINKEEALIANNDKLLFSSVRRQKEFIGSIDVQSYALHKIVKINKNKNSVTFFLSDSSIYENVSDFERQMINDSFYVYDEAAKIILKGIIICRYNYESKNLLMLNVLNSYIPNEHYLTTIKPNESFFYLKTIISFNSYTNKQLRAAVISLLNDEKTMNRIVMLKEPTHESVNSTFFQEMIKKSKINYHILNTEQKLALTKCAFLASDYSLIMGFPGTGKTTLLSSIIKVLVTMNKKIIICAHTNQAVDNILLKLKDYNMDFIRVTNQTYYVNSKLKEYTSTEIIKQLNFDELKRKIENTTIFASTTTSISSEILQNVKFDYCIIDEACQIFEPALIFPLIKSQKFILCGDPYQLSALLRADNNKDIPTLFEKLNNKHPKACTILKCQYRMNSEILSLSNQCVYNNEMKCANKAVEESRLVFDEDLKISLNKEIFYKNNNWLEVALDPKKPVLFIDYSLFLKECPIGKITNGNSNVIEISIIKLLFKSFKILEYDLNNITVITPYKLQESLLKEELNLQNGYNDVITIDKSQGLEKEIIILSMVKTNIKTKLLTDIQRINVAFTRPQKKLIIIGLLDVLGNIGKLGDYIQIINDNNWYEKISNVIE